MSSDEALLAGTVSFGPFTLVKGKRSLNRDGKAVNIGSRALDVLIALTDRAGEVMTARDLKDHVWPDVTVDDANLRVQITTLRKVLGDGKDVSRYIVNVSGRGYVFIAPIVRGAAVASSAIASRSIARIPTKFPPLPTLLHSLIGRLDTVELVSGLLLSRRFVSIVGPGGIGKTSVAIAVAQGMVHEFGIDAVCFVDLGSLADPNDVARTVASMLNCSVAGFAPEPYLRAFLSDKRILIVLDCCEHVIDAVAMLCEGIFRDAPSAHILTTSREALRVEGETIHLITPLGVPPDDEMSAEQALAWPAVQLFMERATSDGSGMTLSDAEAGIVVEICRRLDGMALPIELVAGHVGAFGIRGTADLLDSGAALSLQGRRSALPRHQSLRAMLDWSFRLLSAEEQRTLSRLSAFVGPFTLAAADAVARDMNAEAQAVSNAIAGLFDKSLIRISATDGPAYYRLLDTTRDYAETKLIESGEAQATRQRHAIYFVAFLKLNESETYIFDGRRIDLYTPHIENIRKALSWSFTEAGDASIGIDLTILSSRLLLEVSLFSECREWCQKALMALRRTDRGARRELELQKALAISSMYARGKSDEIQYAFDRALAIAEDLQDTRQQIYLHAGLHVFLTRNGDFKNGLIAAKRSAAAAERSGSAAEKVMAEWILGPANHLAGNQAAGLRHCELGFKLASDVAPVDLNFFGYDQQVRALVAYSQTLWLCGFQDRAGKAAQKAINEATSLAHPVSACIVMIYSVEILLHNGNYEAAVAPLELAIRQSEKYSLAPYRAVGLALKGQLAMALGDVTAGVTMLRDALAAMHAERYHIITSATAAALATGQCRSGDVATARTTIEGALERARHLGEVRWLPTLYCAQGEVLMASSDRSGAEKSFIRAIALAEQQAAPSLELRAAIPLANLWRIEKRTTDAITLLEDISQKLPEPAETKDFVAGRNLLNQLRADAEVR